MVYTMSLQVKVSFFFMTLSSISLSQQQQVAPRLQFTGTLVLTDRSLGLSSPDYMIIPPGERKLRSISYCLCIHPSVVNAASFSSNAIFFFLHCAPVNGSFFVYFVLFLFLISLHYNLNLLRDSQKSYNHGEKLIKEQMTKAYWMCKQTLLGY